MPESEDELIQFGALTKAMTPEGFTPYRMRLESPFGEMVAVVVSEAPLHETLLCLTCMFLDLSRQSCGELGLDPEKEIDSFYVERGDG